MTDKAKKAVYISKNASAACHSLSVMRLNINAADKVPMYAYTSHSDSK